MAHPSVVRRVIPSLNVTVCVLVFAACGSTVDVGRLPTGTGVGSGLGLPSAPSGASLDQALGTSAGVTAATGAPGTGPTRSTASTVAGGSARGPIQIGVLTNDLGKAAKALGIRDPGAPTHEDIFRALIKGQNLQGGVAGRRIDPVFATLEFTNSNYDADHQAACEKFTQDNHVAAVMSLDLEYAQSWNTCMTNAGVPEFAVGWSADLDDSDFNSYPGLFSVRYPSMDRNIRARFEWALSSGYVAAKDKLGVVIQNCSYLDRAYQRTLVPLARENGISLVRVDAKCYQGFSDAGSILAGFQGAVLKLQSKSVKTVLFIDPNRGLPESVFAQQADSQQYYPTYLLDWSPGEPATDPNKWPEKQVANMHALSWNPEQDVANAPTPPRAQAASRKTCLALARAGGLIASTKVDRDAVWDACSAVLALREAMKLSGGQGGIGPLRAAVESLGTLGTDPINLAGRLSLGPGRHDGVNLVAPTAYNANCKCFEYVGIPRTIR